MQPFSQFFILAGAPKSGTTALAKWLEMRSDMCLPEVKEPMFFTDFSNTNWEGPGANRFKCTMIDNEADYLNLFGDSPPNSWAIDASTDYLWCEESAEQIYKWSKRYKVKVAIILRHPVQRVISEYQHTVRDHLETETLLSSLQKEDQRYKENWLPLFYHIRRSNNYRQIKKYQELFGDDLLLIDYKELSSPKKLIRKIEVFLDLPKMDMPKITKQNVSSVYRSKRLAKLLGKKTTAILGRRVVPQWARASIRQLLTKLLRKKFTPTKAEIDLLSNSLAFEIEMCRNDPLIPTKSWGKN